MKVIDIAMAANYLYQDIDSPNYIQYKKEQINNKRDSFVMRFIIYIYNLLKGLGQIKYLKQDLSEGKKIYFYETSNQYRALKPLIDKDDDMLTVSLHSYQEADVGFCEVLPLLFGLLYFPHFCFHFYIKKNIAPEYQLLLDKYLISVGYYKYYVWLFTKHNIKSIIVSNDHTERVRAVILAANFVKLPVTYVQHATVSAYFPPLNLFSLSCLDGQSSLDTYQKIGLVTSKALITGAIRNFTLEKHRKRNKGKDLVVGIAVNNFVEMGKLKQVIAEVRQYKQDIIFKIRLHPAQMKDKKLYNQNFDKEGIVVKGAWQESLDDFFNDIDVLFSGASSIHLDALNVGVLPVIIDIDNSVFDYYGYLAHGCVLDLAGFLRLQPENIDLTLNTLIQKGKYFDNAIDLDHSAKNQCIMNVIDEINNLHQPIVLQKS